MLCESLMKSTSCLWNTLMSRWRRQRSQFQTLHYMLVAWKVFHSFKQSLKRPNVQPIKCQMFKLMLLFIGHHNWTWEKTPKIIYWIGGELAALPLVMKHGDSKQHNVWFQRITLDIIWYDSAAWGLGAWNISEDQVRSLLVYWFIRGQIGAERCN